ncbi:MAG: type II secretion system protein [Arcobacteraceae bacterium]|nr:type II secretion system protein [Arcobacteraceae bacterium]
MKTTLNKKAFSLIELIFTVVIIGIISTVAIPKLMSINSKANVSTIKQDTNSIISAIQSYYIVNNKIDKISDAISINPSVWSVADKTVKYMQNEEECINITIATDNLTITMDETSSAMCQELKDQGIITQVFNLN